jgi:hypothetical protein
MSNDNEEKNYAKLSRDRKACLSIWRDKCADNLEQLRKMLRIVAPFWSEEDMEKWLSLKVDRYYHLKCIEDNKKDNERIKKILDGAGYKF